MANSVMVDNARWLALNTEEEEEEEDDEAESCIFCYANFSVKNDIYDWVHEGMPCCKTKMHLSCLSRWRFKTSTEDLSENKVTWCPVCTSTYMPAAWFFKLVGREIGRYVHLRAYLERTFLNPSIRSEAISRLELRRPKFFLKPELSPSSSSVRHCMGQVWQAMEECTIKAEEAEKHQDHGKFVLNYIMARTGNYRGIPPLDADGNRQWKIWEDVVEEPQPLVDTPNRPGPSIPEPHVHHPAVTAVDQQGGEQQHQQPHLAGLATNVEAVQPGTPVPLPQQVFDVDDDDEDLPDLEVHGQVDSVSDDTDDDDDDAAVPRGRTGSTIPRHQMSQEEQQRARDQEARDQRTQSRATIARLDRNIARIDREINRQLSTVCDFTKKRISVIRCELSAMDKLLSKQEKAIQVLSRQKAQRGSMLTEALGQMNSAATDNSAHNSQVLEKRLNAAQEAARDLSDDMRDRRLHLSFLESQLALEGRPQQLMEPLSLLQN